MLSDHKSVDAGVFMIGGINHGIQSLCRYNNISNVYTDKLELKQIIGMKVGYMCYINCLQTVYNFAQGFAKI